MAPINILSLPIETTQEIGNLIPGDQKTLRLVCSQLNLIFEAGVLDTLIISIMKDTLTTWTCQLEALCLPKSRAAQLARTLKINLQELAFLDTTAQLEQASDDDADILAASMIARRCLEPAISSMKSLKSVVWRAHFVTPSWAQTDVINALANLSHLQDFELSIYASHFPGLQLNHLSGLKKIILTGGCSHIIGGLAEAIAKSPELVHLEVDTRSCTSEVTTFHELLANVPRGITLRLTHLLLDGIYVPFDSLTLPHLRSLVHLNFKLDAYTEPALTKSGFIDPTSGDASTITSDVYATLNREKIHLREVVTSDVSDVILDYLESYSGLEALDFHRFQVEVADVEKSHALGHRFYHCVLPKHVDSIKYLTIRPDYEGEWCYDMGDVSVALAQCKKLKLLAIAVASVPIRARYSDDSFLYSPPGISHEDQVSFNDMIWSLINVSLTLPDLARIHIFSASPQGFRFIPCGNPVIRHQHLVMESIARSVTTFVLNNKDENSGSLTVLPDILLDRRAQQDLYQYQALPVDDGPGRRYRLTHVTRKPWMY